MSVLFTIIVSTRDWKTLRERNQELLVGQAQQAGATRYQVYRNIHDAARALIVAELPDDDALRELRRALREQVGSLDAGGRPDESMWESAGWEGIG
jgi:hypothetical protein